MNSAGFSTILSVIAILILVIIIAIVPGAISRANHEHAIESQIDDLGISADLSSKVCSAGDPIDSPAAFCTYIYSSTLLSIGAMLEGKGFTKASTNTVTTNGGNSTRVDYSGGNPALSVELSAYNGTDSQYTGRTTLTARLASE